jgi:ribosomal-protein-alanine N-acetyltransferase
MARKPSSPYRVTPARPVDLDEIMEIERLGFASPWSRQVFVEEFEQEFSRIVVVRHEDTHRVLAFIIFWVVHDEIHVLNVSTHPDWRRRGLAHRLMDQAIRTGTDRNARLVTLEVRRSNLAAQALYASMGFQQVGVRPRYYENGEDALVMVLEL